MKGVTREWAITMGFCVLVLLALGLSLTWVNIERVDMAYELKRLQTEIDAQEALISKLEVERNTLMTPERLRVLAGQYGLTQARPGQIRRLSDGGDELPSPVIKSVPVPEKPQNQKQPRKGDAVKKAEGKDAARDAGKDGKARKSRKDEGQDQKAEARAESKPEAKTGSRAARQESGTAGKSKNRAPVPFVPDPAKSTDSARAGALVSQARP